MENPFSLAFSLGAVSSNAGSATETDKAVDLSVHDGQKKIRVAPSCVSSKEDLIATPAEYG